MAFFWIVALLGGGYSLFNFRRMGAEVASVYEEVFKLIGYNISLTSGRFLRFAQISILWGSILAVIVGVLGLANVIPIEAPAHDVFIQVFGTLLLVGIPAILVWLKFRGKRSWSESYKVGFLYLGRVFGLIFLAMSVLFGVLTVLDITGATEFGYPAYGLLIIIVSGVIGYAIQYFAARGLKRDKEKYGNR